MQTTEQIHYRGRCAFTCSAKVDGGAVCGGDSPVYSTLTNYPPGHTTRFYKCKECGRTGKAVDRIQKEVS